MSVDDGGSGGGGSGDSTLKGPSWYIEEATGAKLTNLFKRGIGGILLAFAASVIAGIKSLVQLMLTPVKQLAEIARKSVEAFILEPLGIIEAGATASQQGVAQFDLFGLLVAVLIVLGAFELIIQYIQEAETTDVPIPGLIVDVIPFVGVEEESDPEG